MISVDQRAGGSWGHSCGVIGQCASAASGVRHTAEFGDAEGPGARLVPEAREGEGETRVE